MSVILDDDETLALVTLARFVIRADGQVTEAELAAMMAMARDVGLARFYDAFEQSEDAPPLGTDQLTEVARFVQRPESRAFMLRHLAQLARADGIVEAEQRVLDLLEGEWRLSA